ncbi:MAG: HEAT repeat domain-containing protein [Candidatus Micrarchaeota archaeon]|nr:HEAT repeat domain-containing protein [Candidatus Micrarchaeota archaeon]
MKPIKELIKDLESDDKETRRNAIILLSVLYRKMPDPASVFIKATQSPDTAVRFYAVEGLSRLGEKGECAIPYLIEMLKNPEEDNDIRANVLNVLRAFGDKSSAALPYIIPLMLHNNVRLSIHAWAAFERISGIKNVDMELLMHEGKIREYTAPADQSSTQEIKGETKEMLREAEKAFRKQNDKECSTANKLHTGRRKRKLKK